MKNIIILIVFGLAMCDLTSAQSPLPELDKVKEIKLLESTRDDVRRILASYDLGISDDSGHYEWFSNENVHIKIDYSKGDCSNPSEDWNIAEWKVTDIKISPKDSLQIKNVGIDYSNFRKERAYANISGSYVYHRKDEGIAIEVERKEVQTIYLFPPRGNSTSLCNKEDTTKFYLNEIWFSYAPLKERIKIIDYNLFANVVNLTLNRNEIITDCPSFDSTQNKSCSDHIKHIAVFTKAIDPENDVLSYIYLVSGGKIIGAGANVVWDLSSVKAGIYGITAVADDGCGMCGKTMTKIVVVKECPNCSAK